MDEVLSEFEELNRNKKLQSLLWMIKMDDIARVVLDDEDQLLIDRLLMNFSQVE